MNENKLIGYIYIFLFPNNKRYVGQTVGTVEKRVGREIREAERGSQKQPALFNAIRYYGKDNMNIECSFPVYGEQKDLDAAEDEYILWHNTLAPNGYNVKGGGSHGAHSEESKAKISAARKGKPNPMTGRHHSEEAKAKISMGNKGKIVSEEAKARMRGRCLSEETKTKMSAAHKGKPRGLHSEATKAKMSAARIGKLGYWAGKHRSEETKAKISNTKRKCCLEDQQ